MFVLTAGVTTIVGLRITFSNGSLLFKNRLMVCLFISAIIQLKFNF